MSKNKFIKKLLIAGLCAVTATAMIGATACKPDNEEPEKPTGHVCNIDETRWEKNADGHWHPCKNAGHTAAYTPIDHFDNDENGTCDACGWTMPDDGGDEGDEGDETETKDPVVVDFTANTTADGAIATDLGITATSEIAIKDQTRKVVYNGTETTLTKGLKMNGAAKKTEKSFKVNLSENATIIVYAASGSGTADTYLSMLDAEGAVISGTVQQVSFNDSTSSSYAHPAVFSVKANTEYYIGSDSTVEGSSNAVVFRIAVVYGKFTEDKGELVAAKTANCTEDGNIAYYYTKYGRYLNENGSVVGPKQALQPATGHEYVQDGDPTVYPTATTTGKVNLKCENDETHVLTDVVLPALQTKGAYSRETNAEDDTKTDYLYIHPLYGAGILFTADTVSEKEEVLTSYTVDFTDITKFTAEANATSVVLCADKAGKDTEIKFADGGKTGLTAVGTKSDCKEISVSSHTVGENTATALTFGGTIAKDKNAVSFVVPVKGTVTITVSYFSANAGRYIKIMDTSGNSLATTDAAVEGKVVINDGAITDGKTDTDPSDSEGKKSLGTLVTATITLDVSAANTKLLLGSATNGIWITCLDIQWEEAAE